MPQYALDWQPILESNVTTNSSSKVFTVPARKIWRIKSIYIAMTSNASVGNRQMAVDIRDGAGTVVARFEAGAVQAASLTRTYIFAPTVVNLTAFIDTAYLSTPMPEITLPQNFTIRCYDKTAVDASGTAENLLAYILTEQYG